MSRLEIYVCSMKFYAKHLIVVNLFRVSSKMLILKCWFSLDLISKIVVQLLEACRINFHLVAPRKSSMVPSYDRKNKMLTTKKLTTTLMWACKKFRSWMLLCFMCFPYISLDFPGNLKKNPDPGWKWSLSYHTAPPHWANYSWALESSEFS